MSETVGKAGMDLESLLADALRPIEPPERVSGRLEETLSSLADAAATELSDWADELTESELESLRDPRNWVRPVAAAAVGAAAGTALIVVQVRQRRKQDGLAGVADEIRKRFGS
jgi:H+/Cl- antiporter ClcA